MALHAAWVHGNAALLERDNARSATGKKGVLNAFGGNEWRGDVVRIGDWASVACLRLPWAARFVVFDHGSADNPQSGDVVVHYAIPTPVIGTDRRAKARAALVNFVSSNASALRFTRAEVWDGNKRILEHPDPMQSMTAYDGGIGDYTTDPNRVPNAGRLMRLDLGNREVFFGLNVSLTINAHAARDAYLDIRGVGVDFDLP